MTEAPPISRFQLLIKLVDEWKGENQLKLREVLQQIDQQQHQYNKFMDTKLFMKEGLLNVAIADCDFFIQLINMVNMRLPPD